MKPRKGAHVRDTALFHVIFKTTLQVRHLSFLRYLSFLKRENWGLVRLGDFPKISPWQVWREEVDFTFKSVRLLVFTAVLGSIIIPISQMERLKPQRTTGPGHKAPDWSNNRISVHICFDPRDSASKVGTETRSCGQYSVWSESMRHLCDCYLGAPLGGTLMAAGSSWLLLPRVAHAWTGGITITWEFISKGKFQTLS